MAGLRAIDLCCGAGGWACAARGLPIEFVAVADLAADCLETWSVNHLVHHPRCRLLEVDLSTEAGIAAAVEAAGSCDVLLGGIPCEQVSVARGCTTPPDAEEMAAWHRLIDGVLGAVQRTGAKYWCVEDVIQIERHLPLPLWHGREIPSLRINARDFGPQSRLRTFLGVFPAPTPPLHRVPTLGDCLRPGPHLMIPSAECYQAVYALHGSLSLNNDKIRLLDPELPCPTITTSVGVRGGRNKRQFTVLDERGRRRQLSWQEAAAVQGFPDDFVFVGGMTSTQGMIGRAIPIYVGRAILEAICTVRQLENEPLQEVR